MSPLILWNSHHEEKGCILEGRFPHYTFRQAYTYVPVYYTYVLVLGTIGQFIDFYEEGAGIEHFRGHLLEISLR